MLRGLIPISALLVLAAVFAAVGSSGGEMEAPAPPRPTPIREPTFAVAALPAVPDLRSQAGNDGPMTDEEIDEAEGTPQTGQVFEGPATCAPIGIPTPKSRDDATLAWLASQADEEGEIGGHIRPTSLALVAFLGSNHSHRHGPHKKVVKLVLCRLKQVQDPSGAFGTADDHAVATLAMVEAYRRTYSPLFKESAQNGVNTLFRTEDSELVWRVLVLRSAKETHLKIPNGADASIRGRIDAEYDPAVRALARLVTGEKGNVSDLTEVVMRGPTADLPLATLAGTILAKASGGTVWKECAPRVRGDGRESGDRGRLRGDVGRRLREERAPGSRVRARRER